MKKKTTSANQPIPEFKLIEKLGQGGMGSVFKALQLSLDREVALKIMPANLANNPEFKERFFREAKAAGKLNHTNIVQGIDAGESAGYCWIAMELVKGRSVADLLKSKGKLGTKESLSIIMQVAKGLDHASKAGIVHRDVKPENFLISDEGIVKLCDLGISKVSTDASLTQTGHTLGTPHYISPEQARGAHDIDSRADIYSLGASWYHLLSGKTPFEGPTAAVIMTKHITENPKPITTLVENLDRNTVMVLEKMMVKDKANRYQDLKSLIEDLESLEKGSLPLHALPKSAKSVSARTRKITSQAVKAKPVKKTGAISDKSSKKNLYIATGSGIFLVFILIIIFSGSNSEKTKEKTVEPNKVVYKKDEQKNITQKNTKPVVRTEREYSNQSQEISKKISNIPHETDQKNVSSNIEDAYKKLKREIENIPESAQIEYLKQFAGSNKNNEWGAKALQEALEKEKKILQMQRESMERSATEAKNRLPEIEREGAITAYEAFLKDYPGTKAAELVKEKLDDFVRTGSDRFIYAVIPQDEDRALDILEDIAKGNAKAVSEDVIPFVTHRKSDIRKAALRALESTDRELFFKKSLEALKDRNEKVRVTAIENLRPFMAEQKVRQQIIEIMENDPSRIVRHTAERIINER